MVIYLDHASTTPLCDEVYERLKESMRDVYGNPSSLHRKGLQAENILKEARQNIAKLLKVSDREIIFTSGGTEANNLAIQGLVNGKTKGRVITTAIEHPSVLSCVDALADRGYEVVKLPVNSEGVVSVETLESELTEDTLLVTVMHVNNEVGSIQPIEAIGKTIKNYKQKTGAQVKFHVDAVQSFGKMQVLPEKWHVDTLTISGHKINGLKGSGALYKGKSIHLRPLFFGGSQEMGVRPGTENVQGVLAMGEASKMWFNNQKKHYEKVKKLKDQMIAHLRSNEKIVINSPEGSPYILNLSFLETKGEIMLHTLEMKDVYVSTGAACSSKKKNHSHVLEAMGMGDDRLDSALRLSFSPFMNEESIERAAQIILEAGESLSQLIHKQNKRK